LNIHGGAEETADNGTAETFTSQETLDVQLELSEEELTDYRGKCCDKKGGSDDDKSFRVKGT
jgi:uncharacterized cysteine cluster protein YcgN (CxxCxxCC family)